MEIVVYFKQQPFQMDNVKTLVLLILSVWRPNTPQTPGHASIIF